MLKTIFKIGIVLLAMHLIYSFISPKKINSDQIIIKFSSWGSETELKILNPLISEFERQNPDIKIEFIHIPKNYFQKIHLLAASNLMPDVMFLNNLNGTIYYRAGLLEDLNSYLDTNLKKEDFFSKSIEAFTLNGELWAIPRDVSNIVVYYNKDIFDKYGVNYPDNNWTLADFLEIAKKLTRDNIWGVGFEKKAIFWLPFLLSEGGGIVPENEITKPQSVEAIQFYADLINKYNVAPKAFELGSSTNTQLFMQERIAMQITGRWVVPRFREDIKFNWDIAKFPTGKAGSVVPIDSSGWAISKKSQHKAQAWRFVKFLASKNSIEKLTQSGLIIPARADVANSGAFLSNKPTNSIVFLEAIKTGRVTVVPKNYDEILYQIENMLEPVFSGEKTAQRAILQH